VDISATWKKGAGENIEIENRITNSEKKKQSLMNREEKSKR
jgi:hypothetical protein